MNIAPELNMARNMFGRLSPDVRRRLIAYAEKPCAQRWDDIHCIIVGSDGWMTAWQAWIATDRAAPRTGPRSDAKGKRITGWAAWPDANAFRRLMEYATH